MPWMPEHLYTGVILQRLDAFCATADNRQLLLDALIASRDNGPALEVLLADRRFGVLDPGTGEIPPYGIVEPGFRELNDTEQGEWDENGQLRQHELDVDVVEDVPPLKVSEQRHMRVDWFTPKNPAGRGSNRGGWWVGQTASVEETVREGLIQALEVADSEGRHLPIASSWICAGPDEGTFAVSIECFVTWTEQQVNFLILTPEHFGGQMMNRMNKKRSMAGISGASYAAVTGSAFQKSKGSVVVKADASGTLFTKPTEFDPMQLGRDAIYLPAQNGQRPMGDMTRAGTGD